MYIIEPKVNVCEMAGFSNQEVMRYSKDYLGTDKIRLVEDIINWSFCYNFALNNNNVEACDHAIEILNAKYRQISLEEIQAGDVVSYHKCHDELDSDGNNIIIEPDKWNAKHFGKILKSDGTLEGTWIQSKWGRWGIFDTTLDMVCQDYGETIIFWRLI